MGYKEREYGVGGGRSPLDQVAWEGLSEEQGGGWSQPGKHTETVPGGRTPGAMSQKGEKAWYV